MRFVQRPSFVRQPRLVPSAQVMHRGVPEPGEAWLFGGRRLRAALDGPVARGDRRRGCRRRGPADRGGALRRLASSVVVGGTRASGGRGGGVASGGREVLVARRACGLA